MIPPAIKNYLSINNKKNRRYKTENFKVERNSNIDLYQLIYFSYYRTIKLFKKLFIITIIFLFNDNYSNNLHKNAMR